MHSFKNLTEAIMPNPRSNDSLYRERLFGQTLYRGLLTGVCNRLEPPLFFGSFFG